MLVCDRDFFNNGIYLTQSKGFLKIIPFLFGIIGGYIVAIFFGLVDFTKVIEAQMDCFARIILYHSIQMGVFHQYNLYFGPETWALLPVAVVNDC